MITDLPWLSTRNRDEKKKAIQTHITDDHKTYKHGKNDCRPFALRMSLNYWRRDKQNKLEKSNGTEVMYYKYGSQDKASFCRH